MVMLVVCIQCKDSCTHFPLTTCLKSPPVFGHSSQCCAVQEKTIESSVGLSSQGKRTVLSVEELQVYKVIVAMSINSPPAFLTTDGEPTVHPSYKLVTRESINLQQPFVNGTYPLYIN